MRSKNVLLFKTAYKKQTNTFKYQIGAYKKGISQTINAEIVYQKCGFALVLSKSSRDWNKILMYREKLKIRSCHRANTKQELTYLRNSFLIMFNNRKLQQTLKTRQVKLQSPLKIYHLSLVCSPFGLHSGLRYLVGEKSLTTIYSDKIHVQNR